ncbi:hypothetical protein DFQ28_008078 [Apophysomyces sp. BC1034]|nr:hypothetical protein DFQ28_008078 [Apophysomyces sp. BC1034]
MLLSCFWTFILLHLAAAAETLWQDVDTAARIARQVVNDAGIGTMHTLMDDKINPGFGGYPFGVMEYYSGKCSDVGDLLVFMSDLQMNIRNLHNGPNKVSFSIRALKNYNRTTPIEQPRLTLLGEIESVPHEKREDSLACYLPSHPEMKPMQSFHDFRPYMFRNAHKLDERVFVQQ